MTRSSKYCRLAPAEQGVTECDQGVAEFVPGVIVPEVIEPGVILPGVTVPGVTVPGVTVAGVTATDPAI